MLNWLKSEYIVYVLCNQSVFHLILDIKKCMYTSVHSKDAITGKKSVAQVKISEFTQNKISFQTSKSL